MGFFFGTILSLLAIFLILLVLVQRGRGGGLAGALGGMGGSSAFGAKAGDVFTRITIIVVSVWIAFCILAGHWARNQGDLLSGGTGITAPSSEPASSVPVGPGLSAPQNEKSETPEKQSDAAAASTPSATPAKGSGVESNSGGETKADAPADEKK